jgi:hypothetical protein
MFGLHMGGVEPRRHRLDALALTGQQQAGAVGLWASPLGVEGLLKNPER